MIEFWGEDIVSEVKHSQHRIGHTCCQCWTSPGEKMKTEPVGDGLYKVGNHGVVTEPGHEDKGANKVHNVLVLAKILG